MAVNQYTCVEDQCDRPVFKNGSCDTHHEKKTCGYPGCQSIKKTFGYCNAHSQRLLRNGHLDRKCQRCDTEIPMDAGVGLRYCSDVCLDGECSVDGCESSILALGYCKPHYRRFKSTGHPLRKCAGCGGYIPVTVYGRKRFCSDSCKPICGAPECGRIATDGGYCDRHALSVRYHGSLPDLDFTCGFCGKYVTRSYSVMHQKTNRKTCPECTVLKCRDHQKYRRKVIKSGSADCGICGKGIRLDLAWPNPMSLSIDHIVPVTRGGTNREQNLQPSHAGCNLKKRNWLAPPIDGILTLI